MGKMPLSNEELVLVMMKSCSQLCRDVSYVITVAKPVLNLLARLSGGKGTPMASQRSCRIVQLVGYIESDYNYEHLTLLCFQSLSCL